MILGATLVDKARLPFSAKRDAKQLVRNTLKLPLLHQ
jgi:hypothetical protein